MASANQNERAVALCRGSQDDGDMMRRDSENNADRQAIYMQAL